MAPEKDNVLFDDKDFNFDEANVAGPKVNDLTPEELEEDMRIDIEITEEQRASKGFPTAKVIAEARKLAESKVGLDVEKFFTKHGLVNCNIEQLLHAPLHEKGPKKGTFK